MATGVLISTGWWILIGGVTYGDQEWLLEQGQPVFQWLFYVPALLVCFSVFLLNLVKPQHLTNTWEMGADISMRARIWVFITATMAFCCVGSAMWIAANHYPSDVIPTPLPGICLVLQTIFVSAGGVVFFLLRGSSVPSF